METNAASTLEYLEKMLESGSTLVGATIVSNIKYRGWSVADLAARSGVDEDTIHRLKHGEYVSTSDAEAIAKALGLDLISLQLFSAPRHRIVVEMGYPTEFSVRFGRLRSTIDQLLQKLEVHQKQARIKIDAMRSHQQFGPQQLTSLLRVTHPYSYPITPVRTRGDTRNQDDTLATSELKFRLVAPINTLVRNSASFHWTQQPGAVSYSIYIESQVGPTIEGDPLTATKWVPPDLLRSGQSYVWSVAAKLADDRFETTANAAFAVLDRDREQEVNQLAKQYAGSPIALGGLYVEAGLLDEAEQSFEYALLQHPDSKEAREVLDELQALRGNERTATE